MTYISPLFKEVPPTKLKPTDPEWDSYKCWHCQENSRVIKDPDVIIWCMRCYILQHKKVNGTFIDQKGLTPIGKDLVNTEENRKVFKKAMKFDVGHRIDRVINEE